MESATAIIVAANAVALAGNAGDSLSAIALTCTYLHSLAQVTVSSSHSTRPRVESVNSVYTGIIERIPGWRGCQRYDLTTFDDQDEEYAGQVYSHNHRPYPLNLEPLTLEQQRQTKQYGYITCDVGHRAESLCRE